MLILSARSIVAHLLLKVCSPSLKQKETRLILTANVTLDVVVGANGFVLITELVALM